MFWAHPTRSRHEPHPANLLESELGSSDSRMHAEWLFTGNPGMFGAPSFGLVILSQFHMI